MSLMTAIDDLRPVREEGMISELDHPRARTKQMLIGMKETERLERKENE
jgi:hypothetical protein